MGRGRAKAKQVKVARQLKYKSSDGTDLERLRAEIAKSSGNGSFDSADADYDDEDDDAGSEEDDDAEDSWDDTEDAWRGSHGR